MASVAIENLETPVVEKDVEDVDVPKVVDDEVVENGKSAVTEGDAVPENGTSEAADDAVVTSTPEEDDAAEVVQEAKNGDSTDAPAEAVKRKADVDSVDAPATEEAVCPTPEKKSKLDESATENGTAEEVVA